MRRPGRCGHAQDQPPHHRGRSCNASRRHQGRSPATNPGDDRSARPRHRTVATWTIVSSGQPVPWASRSRWASQPRPLRGADPSSVPPPFRGATLDDRHPADPLQPFTEEERQGLCATCGVPVIHRSTHLRGPLHRVRTDMARTARARTTSITEYDLAAAVALIQRHRPELLLPPRAATQTPAALDTDLIDLLDEDMPEN